MISQVTVAVQHIKNHSAVLVMMSEAADDDVSELHAAVYRAFNSADAEI